MNMNYGDYVADYRFVDVYDKSIGYGGDIGHEGDFIDMNESRWDDCRDALLRGEWVPFKHCDDLLIRLS